MVLLQGAKDMVTSLLLQDSIEKQVTKLYAAAPILTQTAYTSLVNRLVLLLKRAEADASIPVKLKRRGQALVEKSHSEYWLQVSSQQLSTVECADESNSQDMKKLESCIFQAKKSKAKYELLQACQALHERLKSEVDINRAMGAFPSVRLPIEEMPKDYWKEEDTGHVEETEGFPLPPVDDEGKPLDYIWIQSKSFRELSAACKNMGAALTAAEVLGGNGGLVERGHARLVEAQKDLRVLTEKDTLDRDKAIAVTVKAAKKLKKKKGKKKK
ncbi:unnamed protein product [Choristocarpus tenellus]